MIRRSLNKTVEVVWSQDPALDKDAAEFAAAFKRHIEEGADAATLPTKPGEPLAVFEIRPLDPDAWTRCLRMEKHDQDLEVVACGLQSVRGFVTDGKAVSLEVKDGRVTAASLRLIYDPRLFQEVASRIVVISMLHPFRG